MILLDATTRKLQVVLAAAVTTTNSPWVASYVDIAQSGFAMTGANSATGASNGVTAVDVVAAPAASTTRQLKYFSLLNADTVTITATIRYNDNATIRNMVTFILSIGSSLIYSSEFGWTVTSPTVASSQILGTSTNDNASAGIVGEYKEALIPSSGTNVGYTNANLATVFDILSLSLTAGDWDLWGTIIFSSQGTTTSSLLLGWSNTASVTQPTYPNGGAVIADTASYTLTSGAQAQLSIGKKRQSLAATTTMYLSAFIAGSGSNVSAAGILAARRAR